MAFRSSAVPSSLAGEGSKDQREAQFMRLRERIESRLAALSPWTWPVENGGLFYESSARRSRPAFLDVSQ
jgi:hypothetical protein